MDLLRLAIVLTGEVNTAEDIVHDVFVGFAQSVQRISPVGSLKGYLVASTLNRARNYRRDRARHGERNLDGAAAVPSGAGQPEHWAIVSEQLERLSRAMAQLPYEQREVVTLRIQGDMTLRSIARRQKTSISTVQSRYRYGIDKLRSLLNGELSP